MGKKHKLIRVPEDKLRTDAKNEIIDFIQTRYLKGLTTQLQDIQNMFGQPPYSLSEGSVINYLNELVDNRKLSTWKEKNLRYYGPPKIPLPIKIGLASSALIIAFGVLIDIFVPPDWVYSYIYLGITTSSSEIPTYLTTRPLIIYLLSVVFILCTIWYLSTRKVYK